MWHVMMACLLSNIPPTPGPREHCGVTFLRKHETVLVDHRAQPSAIRLGVEFYSVCPVLRVTAFYRLRTTSDAFVVAKAERRRLAYWITVPYGDVSHYFWTISVDGIEGTIQLGSKDDPYEVDVSVVAKVPRGEHKPLRRVGGALTLAALAGMVLTNLLGTPTPQQPVVSEPFEPAPPFFFPLPAPTAPPSPLPTPSPAAVSRRSRRLSFQLQLEW
jgi:hypothetical protein